MGNDANKREGFPTIYFCKNSYGINNIMSECTHGLDTTKCGRHCEQFVRREVPNNEDEVMLQSLEWNN